MNILMWIVRILIILFLIRMLIRMLFPRGIQAPRPKRGSLERSGGTLVRDPQCGTYLPQSRALTLGAGASAQYFCSTKCRDEYAAAMRRGA